jgi:hypothetical protein
MEFSGNSSWPVIDRRCCSICDLAVALPATTGAQEKWHEGIETSPGLEEETPEVILIDQRKI